MRYKKFSNCNNLEHKTSENSISSLEEIPLPNEIEIQPQDNEFLNTTSSGENTVNIPEKKILNLNRLIKNIDLDDILLVAILILLLQEDVSDEILICFIVILLIQK